MTECVPTIENIYDKFHFICYRRHKEAVNDIQFARMERNLYKLRQNVMPSSPQTPEEILNMFGTENIMNMYGKSLNGEPFFVDTIIDKDYSYTIFKSDGICEFIKTLPNSQKKYMLDGTFKSCPLGRYNQLLISLIMRIIYLEYYECCTM